jgi:hypothetical protein
MVSKHNEIQPFWFATPPAPKELAGSVAADAVGLSERDAALEEAALIAEKIRFAWPASPTERAFNTGIESAAKCIRQAQHTATKEAASQAPGPIEIGSRGMKDIRQAEIAIKSLARTVSQQDGHTQLVMDDDIAVLTCFIAALNKGG